MNQVIWQPGMTIADMEKRIILAALRYHGGNKTKTADSLAIAIRTLDYKLEKYLQKEPSNEKKIDLDESETQN